MSYRRIYVTATVELTSPLHIGSGEEAPIAERMLATINKARHDAFPDWTACRAELKVDMPEGRYQRTYRSQGRAAIPASSFRGLWRRAVDDHGVLGRFFGDLADQGSHLSAGWLRLRDLRLDNPLLPLPATKHPLPDATAGTAVTQGIRIDPVTGTVADKFLWSYEYAPAGSRFKLSAEVVPPIGVQITEDDTRELLRGLLQVGQSPALAIGHATTKGMGLARVTIDEVRTLDDAAFAAWVREPAKSPRDAAAAQKGLIPESGPPASVALTCDLEFPFGLVVGEPFLSQAKRRGGDAGDRRGTAATANQQYARDVAGRPLIRGSSLKGLLRAHASRIMAAALVSQPHGTAQEAAAAARSAVQGLFGSHARKAGISVSEARWLASTATTEDVLRTFVAVDRLTGGAADQKLYDALVANACNMRCQITALRPLEPWERGLLLHVLRDALDGDLAVGWGKSKGLGAFRVSRASDGKTVVDSSVALRQLARENETLRSNLAAFDQHVAKLAAKAPESA